MRAFDSFLGLDQTGAVDSKGVPRPLPICFLDGDRVELGYLPKFDPHSIWQRWPGRDPAVVMDCVLGLPVGSKKSWQEAVTETRGTEGYGRRVACEFFRSLRGDEIPRRQVERTLKANSVFQEHPFQKNIQTGTFRLWKEIAAHRSSIHVPWIEGPAIQSSPKIEIFEGYPSWVWKTLLKAPKRSPKDLPGLLKRAGIPIKLSSLHRKQLEKDPNLADAFVLSLAGAQWLELERRRPAHPEGWILGGDR